MAPLAKAFVALSSSLAALLPVAVEPGFSNAAISKVRSNMIGIAHASWELGTAAQVLTELSWPSLSVFNTTAFPPRTRLTGKSIPTEVMKIAQNVVSSKPSNSLPLIANEGSAADPASLGVSVLLANWTRFDLSDHTYADAAAGQLRYLLEKAPRTASGAISHRANEVQLWSDFVYMVPPFIAYYGALQGGLEGRRLLQIAYDQCKLYRDGLKDNNGLWRHISQGSFSDNTHWATGNAWAAAGMLRVLSSLNNTSLGRQFSKQQSDLSVWIDEILEASWTHQESNGALHNVIDDPNTFVDTASTSLLAAVTYRMAVFKDDGAHVPSANLALKWIKNNVDKDGWLRNAVDPLAFHAPLKPGAHSPEGQAFVLLLHSAWRAYLDYVTRETTLREAVLI